eukprot:4933943-Amphidinium_carterae.4
MSCSQKLFFVLALVMGFILGRATGSKELQAHFGSMDSQNHGGQCSQRQGDHFGLTLGQKTSQQCNQRDSGDSFGAGRLPNQ